MRQRARTTSSLRTALYDERVSPKVGLTQWSLLCTALFQVVCHLETRYVLIRGLKSVWGSFNFAAFRFNDDLAALSASSLPWMPTWPGSQQNTMLLQDASLWYFMRSCWTSGLEVFLLLRDWRTERESEKMMNFFPLLVFMKRRARSIAWISAEKIDAPSGSLTLKVWNSLTDAQPTLSPSLEPSV